MSVTLRVDNEGKHASWSGGSSAWERLPKQVSGLDFNENTCISPLSFCVCSLGSWGKPGSSRGWERSGRMLGSQQLIPGLLPAWSALSRHISTHIARIYQTNSETISHHIPSYHCSISHHIPSYPIISHLTSKSDVSYCFMMFLFSPSLRSIQFKHIQNIQYT